MFILIIIGMLAMRKNFKYLDELIHNGSKIVTLASDIVLDEYEESEYFDGIKLDVDDLIIEANGHAVDANGKARIFHCTAKDVTIKNIVLKNAVGAIFNFKGVLNIVGSTLMSNTTDLAGGAVYNSWGMLNIEDSILCDNSSECHGGAIFNFNGTVNIKNSKLSQNNAKNDGGAIFTGAELNIQDCKLSKNTAGGSGGAIYDNRGEINITGSELSNNVSDGIFGGGAIHKNRGKLNVSCSSLSHNLAKGDGGAVFNIDAELAMASSALFNNASGCRGGAIYSDGVLEISDCEICGNAADDCGAIYARNGQDLNLKDCIFKDNSPE
jgi:predicted outer membrane repeat protein